MYARAFRMLNRFVHLVPHDQLLPGLSTYARALAGVGQIDRFRTTQHRVQALVADAPEHRAVCFIHLAEGFRLLGRWDEARALALQAKTAAEESGEDGIRRDAVALLHDIAKRRLPAENTGALDAEFETLAQHFKARLGRWKPQTTEQTAEGHLRHSG